MIQLLLLFLVHAAHAAGVSFPSTTSLTTTDGARISAAWGQPQGAKDGVVFVHMAGHTREEWSSLADKVYRQGVAVLTLDLRGHGASLGGAAPGTLTDADYLKMTSDVAAGVAFLRSKGVARVSLVGAELGANLAINVAAADPAVGAVVLLSPGQVVKGVPTTDATRGYGARPLLLVASNDDAYSARTIGALAAVATAEDPIKLYDTAGKGTKMLVREPTLEPLINGFLKRLWDTPVPATPAAGGPSGAAKATSARASSH